MHHHHKMHMPPTSAVCDLLFFRAVAIRWNDKQQMDAYDHVWGIFITSAGKRRRMDVIIIPPGMCWPFAQLGWTGKSPCCC